MLKKQLLVFLFGLGAGCVVAGDINLLTPEGALAANRKIQCSLKDNQPTLYTWEGEAFSHRQGEPDQRLFKVLGMNVRQCVTVEGGKRGKGYRLVSREILLYLDPKTGQPLKQWLNPWLNRTVDVLQTTNDPVNQPPQFPFKEDGSAAAKWVAREQGSNWFLTMTVPLFYQNPLQGQYQRYVGGAYHATEMFNFMGSLAELRAGDKDEALDVKVGWVRLAEWLPWMEMQGREGRMYIHAAGQKVPGFADLPPVLQDFIKEQAPDYRLPPDGGDSRPNETSWTLFQKKIKGEPLKRGGH